LRLAGTDGLEATGDTRETASSRLGPLVAAGAKRSRDPNLYIDPGAEDGLVGVRDFRAAGARGIGRAIDLLIERGVFFPSLVTAEKDC
jgi:hypothetical protein